MASEEFNKNTHPKIQIIDDTEQFCVVDKPAGIEVHCSGSTQSHEQTLLSLLAEAIPNTSLFPCHRLDKVTSGLILLAKQKESAAELAKQFEQRNVQKIYFAISNRKPIKKQGLIKGDMQKARNGSWKLARSQDNPAVTRFYSQSIGDGHRLYILKPKTGKTHQLRVALKSIGAPIMGDERYGGQDSDRCYLHATYLSFEFAGATYQYHSLPDTGEYFSTPEFRQCVKALGPLEQLKWP